MKIKIRKNMLILILAIIILLVILALIGILYRDRYMENSVNKKYPWFKDKFEKALEADSTDFLDSKISVEEELELFEKIGQIIKSLDFDACDQIEREELKVVCKNEIAQKNAYDKLDVNWCLKLDNKIRNIGDCVSDIISLKAKDENDVRVCSKAKDLGYSRAEEMCLLNFWINKAVEEKDEMFCNNIEDQEARDHCRREVVFN